MVADFHQRFGFPIKLKLADADPKNDGLIGRIGVSLMRKSETLKTQAIWQEADGDSRLYRIYHKLEELAELCDGLSRRDEVATADALGDMMYLTLGDGVSYDLPMAEVFAEIHRSNMTKTRTEDDTRMKERSPESGFSHPDLATAIKTGRGRDSL